jgi:hypothetical protein
MMLMMKGGGSKNKGSRPCPAVFEGEEKAPHYDNSNHSKEPDKIEPENDKDSLPTCSSPQHIPSTPDPVSTIQDLDFLYYYLRNMWKEAAQMLSHTGMTAEEIKAKSKKLWFQKTFNNKDNVNPDLLETPHYVYEKEELEKVEVHPLSYVMVLKDFLGKWNISNELFDIDYIKDKYGNHYTDIRIQTPLIQGFNLRNSKYTQEIDEMLVKDYVEYQKSHQNMYLLKEETMDERIKFAVNLDIGNFPDQLLELYTKVPSWLYCNREEDLQSFLRRHIPGMSVPQIYLKVAGCWTGGHQENLSLRAVNINHGPGEVEWYCMEADEAYRFNSHILHDKKLNLLKLEGLWYIPLEDVLRRGFKVSKFVQQTGDVVVLAPGTLHWVRSYSYTVNSAWNIGEFNYLQVDQLFKRYDFNIEYGFRNLIPVKTLTLDIINNAAYKMDSKGFDLLKERLLLYLRDAIKVLQHVPEVSSEQEMDNTSVNNVVMCNKCLAETFESWFYLNESGKEDAEFDIENILCYKCVSKIRKQDRIIAFIKFDIKDLKRFITIIEDLKYKGLKNEKYPLMARIASPKYYIRSTVSEYYKAHDGKFSPIRNSDDIFEDPKMLITDKNYLSRKTMASANTFDKDALLYKIKRKDSKPDPSSPPRSDLPLNEQKIELKKQPEQEVPPALSLKEQILSATKDFFREHQDLKMTIGEDMFNSIYSGYEEKMRSGCASFLAIVRGMLMEDVFAKLEPVDKMYSVFLYLEGILNPEESKFIKVHDEQIYDANIKERLTQFAKKIVQTN